MDKDQLLIRKLVDYVLLNAYSVNSTGLYNGKAGISLSLFCAARLLNDDYIEDQAYELLQEALLSTNKDISFEDGLAGVGFVLRYLINNQFIEADFKELFDEQVTKIIESLKRVQRKENKEMIVWHISLVHFLDAVKDEYVDTELREIIDMFSSGAARWLEDKFDKLEEIINGECTDEILRLFESYLKMVDYNDSFVPEWNVLEKYGKLYQSDKLISSFVIGYHLRNIAVRNGNLNLEAIAIKNLQRATLNLYPDTMSLSERIDCLYLLNESDRELPQLMQIVENELLNTTQSKGYEQYIQSSIYPTGLTAGYQYGISRLILYEVYKKTPDVVRYLFL